MDYLQLSVAAGLVLLLACCIAWILVYRGLQRHPGNHRYYRWHQVLLALIAALAILIPIVVVLSSDPGDPAALRFDP